MMSYLVGFLFRGKNLIFGVITITRLLFFRFNLDRPVRVCNRCKLMLSGPQVASGNAQTAPGSEATSPPPSANSQTSGGNGSGDSAQHNFFQRNFGMVS